MRGADALMVTCGVSSSSEPIKNMKTLITKCERIEAAFRAIKRELETLPKSELVDALRQQNELDIAAAVERARIARDVLKRGPAG